MNKHRDYRIWIYMKFDEKTVQLKMVIKIWGRKPFRCDMALAPLTFVFLFDVLFLQRFIQHRQK